MLGGGGGGLTGKDGIAKVGKRRSSREVGKFERHEEEEEDTEFRAEVMNVDLFVLRGFSRKITPCSNHMKFFKNAFILVFRCDCAFLEEGVSVRPSVFPSVSNAFNL